MLCIKPVLILHVPKPFDVAHEVLVLLDTPIPEFDAAQNTVHGAAAGLALSRSMLPRAPPPARRAQSAA